ncbi:MAG: rod shape-determining protein MreC [Acidimicrobiales bacterium]
MAATRRSARPRFVLVVLLLASITVLTLDYRGGAAPALGSIKAGARDLVAPVESGMRSVTHPVTSFFEGAASYSSLRSQNARLRQEITRLRAGATSAGAAESKLAAITALDHLGYAPNVPKVPAGVVSSAPSNFELSVVIDKGSRAGIAVGMPVVSGTGLVGKVIETSKTRSTVMLATDPSFAVGVGFGAKGSLGVASGQGTRNPLRVDYVTPGTAIHKSELAQTAEVKGGTFPPGIPVGTVDAVSDPQGALQETITLSPLAELSGLEFVDVLRWSPPSQP